MAFMLTLKTDWDFTVETPDDIHPTDDIRCRVSSFDQLAEIRDSIDGKAQDIIEKINEIIDGELTELSMTGGNHEIEWCEIPPPRFGSYRIDDELSDLPEEFRSAIYSMAYEAGHSAGISEVECIVSDMVGELIGPIRKYTKRIKG
jgi:hypothetical protein